jgi:hypothetical protein
MKECIIIVFCFFFVLSGCTVSSSKPTVLPVPYNDGGLSKEADSLWEIIEKTWDITTGLPALPRIEGELLSEYKSRFYEHYRQKAVRRKLRYDYIKSLPDIDSLMALNILNAVRSADDRHRIQLLEQSLQSSTGAQQGDSEGTP